MTAVFAESIDLLLPQLSAALLEPNQVPGLKILASQMAPILRGGFECRLGDNSPQVDIQQCVISGNDEPALLKKYLAEPSLAINPLWNHIQTFLHHWSDPDSSLHDSIPEIWLEFDSDVSNPRLLPSLFFALPTHLSDPSQSFVQASQVLNSLLGSTWVPWQDSLKRCFTACPEGIFVSHIGVMLSRSVEALRVNVKRLQPELLVPYLQRIKWLGQTDEIESLMTKLATQMDRITVCLDVGQQVYPKLGFECIFLKQPQDEPGWANFLDTLVDQGCCTPAKRQAFLQWPGQTTPMTIPTHWPGELIKASLLRPQNCFTSLSRRVSHIKVVYHPHSPLEAKGYLWFAHEWLSPPSASKPSSISVSMD
ncbi:hypothetical protein [Adonisia turfae]|uniref:Uncharacterized protein n=1 Tax=Adonisia turfae CCMR0081 TaxID=2292702 RepID=A0A6M0RHE3_9CYAN|nr:hypothetical protein [Adonisia turfae]NEZ55283.1 hypothetical protein [Adonisia turfae CCMR0081]